MPSSLEKCKNCNKSLKEKREGNYCSKKCYFKAKPEVYKKLLKYQKKYYCKNRERICKQTEEYRLKNKSKINKYQRGYKKEYNRKQKETMENNAKEYIKFRCELHQKFFEEMGFKDIVPVIVDEHKVKYKDSDNAITKLINENRVKNMREKKDVCK